MFKALYIITRAGMPLFIYEPEHVNKTSEEAQTLFSGMLTALMRFLVEVEVGEVKDFVTESNRVSISTTDDYAVVLVSEMATNLSDEDISLLLDRSRAEISLILQNKSPMSVVTNALDDLFNSVFERIIADWKKEISKSVASKKMQKSLW
ncbi:MAG: hypothetical protein GPJ54_03840 [Candidatus Heimdallarchaeota archaeon]|nr:hypothetical protein [Candidatus Heimdallarchaeota archaeon]